MDQISRDEVVKLAQLSALQLSDGEVEVMRRQLPEVLSYVRQLDELDTEGVEPAYQVTGLTNVLRPDDVCESDVSGQDLVALSHETKDGFIKVPKVL